MGGTAAAPVWMTMRGGCTAPFSAADCHANQSWANASRAAVPDHGAATRLACSSLNAGPISLASDTDEGGQCHGCPDRDLEPGKLVQAAQQVRAEN
jgi:hypothetical protein